MLLVLTFSYLDWNSFVCVHQVQVSPYLRSRNWDSRVAAAQAIGAIAESVKHASLSEVFSLMEEEMATCGFSDHTKDIAAACSSIHPGTVAGLSFRRSNIIYPSCISNVFYSFLFLFHYPLR